LSASRVLPESARGALEVVFLQNIDTHVNMPRDMPKDAELQAQIDASLSLAHRRILQTVKENMRLLESRIHMGP